jgi:hypothetical protein
MSINAVPNEILAVILEQAAELNKKEGVTFTFGLSQPSEDRKIQRYVKGPLPPALVKYDATLAIGAVCRRWHDWKINYAFKDVFIKCWRGSERWADLPIARGENFPLNLLFFSGEVGRTTFTICRKIRCRSLNEVQPISPQTEKRTTIFKFT